MIKLKIFIKIIISLLFTFSSLAENYVKNVSGISELADKSVKAAVSQINNDTEKVINNLNNEVEKLNVSENDIENALDVSIGEAQKALEFVQESLNSGDMPAAVQSLNLIESVADIAINSVPTINQLDNINLKEEFSEEEISALASVTGAMVVEKVLDVQKMAGQINVVNKAGLDTSNMMNNLDKNGVGIGSVLTNLSEVGVVNVEKITGKKDFQIESFNTETFSSMDVVEIGMNPTLMQGALGELPLGAATKALETLSKDPNEIMNLDASLITSEAIAETLGLTTNSIAKTMSLKGLSVETISDVGKNLSIENISEISDEITTQSSLSDLSEIIQSTGLENVTESIELAFTDETIGVTKAITANVSLISEALSKKSVNKGLKNDSETLESIELPENISDTGILVGAAILAKPNLASGVQGLVAPPEGLTSGGLISDTNISVESNLTNVDETLATSNAMKETLGKMTNIEINKIEDLGIDKIVDNTGLTPGLVATIGSVGLNGLDINKAVAENVAGIGSETIQKISQSINDGTANSQTVADLIASGSVNHGTLGLVGEDGVKNLSEAMGIKNEDNALVSLSGGIVGSGSVESLENINPEVVQSLGIDPSMITSNAIAETMLGVDLVKMSAAISNGMNLTDALESSALEDLGEVEKNIAEMALSQSLASGQLISDEDIEVSADISGLDQSLVTSNAMAETLGAAASNMESGMALDPNAPTNQPGYNAIDPETGEAPKP